MSWFIFALICVFGWGLADMFYKKGSDEDDRYSHLKIAVSVGIVMGAVSLILLFLRPEGVMSFGELLSDIVIYSPASLSYIVSMVIGYAGLRYLELSVVSPIQNASGALSTVAMILWLMISGRMESIGEAYSGLDFVGSIMITAGVIALAFCERKLSREVACESGDKEKAEKPRGDVRAVADEPGDKEKAEKTKSDVRAVAYELGDKEKVQLKKYRFGALALIFPILYCVFDTIGTAADGILLGSPEISNLSETDVLILYGLTFFVAGIICYLILKIKTGAFYNPFKKDEHPKLYAAIAEEFGQVFYIYAMAKNPLFAAPMVASYCVISMILSRFFLKERLKQEQYICLAFIVTGILMLGISEGVG